MVKNNASGDGHQTIACRLARPDDAFCAVLFNLPTNGSTCLSHRTNKQEYDVDTLLVFKLTRTCPEAGPGPHLCR